MGAVNLLSGDALLTKKSVNVGVLPSILSYDSDLGVFKVILQTGNIWGTFLPRQVTAVSSEITGSVFKSQWLHTTVKYETGDEIQLSYKNSNLEKVENAKKWIDYAVKRDDAVKDVMVLMTTREKVPVSDVSAILAKYGLPSGEAEARKLIEQGITKNGIQGVLDETQFVSKTALNREQVRYEVITKFEMGKDGVVVLKCPNCGASLPLQSKDPHGTCKYCGSSYNVPRNVLNLL